MYEYKFCLEQILRYLLNIKSIRHINFCFDLTNVMFEAFGRLETIF